MQSNQDQSISFSFDCHKSAVGNLFFNDATQLSSIFDREKKSATRSTSDGVFLRNKKFVATFKQHIMLHWQYYYDIKFKKYVLSNHLVAMLQFYSVTKSPLRVRDPLVVCSGSGFLLLLLLKPYQSEMAKMAARLGHQRSWSHFVLRSQSHNKTGLLQLFSILGQVCCSSASGSVAAPAGAAPNACSPGALLAGHMGERELFCRQTCVADGATKTYSACFGSRSAIAGSAPKHALEGARAQPKGT